MVRKIKSRIVLFLSLVLMVSLMFHVPQPVLAQDELNPSSVSISGSIVDNYANISYSLLFDNTGSEVATEIEWYFLMSSGIRLSNISLLLGDLMYWGQAKEEKQAITEYNQTVQRNKTGVLVRRIGSFYRISFNIENGTEALLTIFAEGLLTRNRGLYVMDFPISTDYFTADFSFDISIISHLGSIDGYSVEGLTSFNADTITDGIRIHHTSSGTIVPQEISLTYFLERQLGGSQLLTYDNGSQDFFMYLLAPSSSESAEMTAKQIVFVIDISGSMSGSKISQAKIAFGAMLDTLISDDLFNIITFHGDVMTLWTELKPASASNVDEAEDYVAGLTAGGGTNFHGACMTGLSLFEEGDETKVMMVLSDGEPTSGTITDPDEIESAILEGNTMGVSISTIAFGEGANQDMMSNIAAQNNGAFIFVADNDEAATKILEFYYQFSTPLAYNYTIDVIGEVEYNHRYALEDTPFFNGTEVVITGRYFDSLTINTDIHYISGPESYVNTAGSGDLDKPHVAYAWAQTKIDQLLLVASWNETEDLRRAIVNLALEYGLIVEGYTAIILKVEDPESTTTTTTRLETTITADRYPGWMNTASTTQATSTQGTWTSTTTAYTEPPTSSTLEPAAIDPGGPLLTVILLIGGAASISLVVVVIFMRKYRVSG